MNKQIIQWVFLVILIVAIVKLIWVYTADYIPEVLMAEAIPVALVIGLCSIAYAIVYKE